MNVISALSDPFFHPSLISFKGRILITFFFDEILPTLVKHNLLRKARFFIKNFASPQICNAFSYYYRIDISNGRISKMVFFYVKLIKYLRAFVLHPQIHANERTEMKCQEQATTLIKTPHF